MDKQTIKIRQFIKLIRNNTDSSPESPLKQKGSLRATKEKVRAGNKLYQKVNFCVSPEHADYSPLAKQVSGKESFSTELMCFCSQDMNYKRQLIRQKMTRNQVSIKFPQLNLVKETLDVQERSPEPKEETRRKLKHKLLLEHKKVKKSHSVRCTLSEVVRLDPMNLSGWNDSF